MCRPKKNNDAPLMEKHKLLSSIYTAEFFSGTEIASEPITTVTRIFNASIEDRRAIPRDVSSSALEAFAPEKEKILLDDKEWKCISCNKGASSYCSSVVGAPSMENVICFTEKIYVVCCDEECIDKVTRKKNENSKKLVASDFDFRFSFRSALRPIRIGALESVLDEDEPVEKEVMKQKTEMESKITEEGNPRKESNVQTDSESAMNFVSVNETKTKKRKHEAIEHPTQELHPNKSESNEERHKRIKKNVDNVGAVLSSVDVGGAYMSKSIQSRTTKDTKKQDDGVKENMEVNAVEGSNIEPKSGPKCTKVYLREFPFIFDGKGAWLCRHCLGVPYHSGSHHYHPSHIGKPPSNYFIDQHLRLCPVMFRHFS
eukprot:CAMPEP_0201717558 /NCGR_PEP_ID=MMETSP0593-20130828/3264_1 /ASSEMBLY_ACC=CAM_ASM_000672 /TAXON_ID=267983 /ORGANISM="Skeletonema japonicum, Strain CCMP2506" /LENGTH=371 /DNA_ID=CAMNT_0048207647 /DNA_START=190 /DNA_END=1305 /DNA_ORIENTATION=-